MRIFTLCILVCFFQPTFGQQKSSPFNKFGRVTIENLKRTKYAIDSNANAVVLSDIGNTRIEGSRSGWFALVTYRHTVIHILNKNGYEEANIQIPLYMDNQAAEKITSLKAVTYNLENGKMHTSKLEKSGQFTETINKNRKLVKFTMPRVKEGSIIEFQYEVTSDFISIPDPWYFQRLTAPTLWSEFTFTVPQFFEYNFLKRGYLKLDHTDRKDRVTSFRVSGGEYASSSDNVSFSSGVSDFKWVVENAPELKTENFTSSIHNHITRMEFQLIAQSTPLTPKSFRSSWKEITDNLLTSESFGSKLDAGNHWMADDLKSILKEESSVSKGRQIYEFVRDNFISDGKYGIYLNQPIRATFKKKQGSVPDINLLLTAMLRYAGLDADPVLLSTVKNGYVYEHAPMINNLNYLIVQLKDGNQTFYLDATKPGLSFGRLPLDCYNGYARVISKDGSSVSLMADSIEENKITTFLVVPDEAGSLQGRLSQTPGYYESLSIRNQISESGQNNFLTNLQQKYSTYASISSMKIDSLKHNDHPLNIQYEISFMNQGEDFLYLNPTFSEGYKKNPFTATNRAYPVEMPYKINEQIIASIKIPNGYQVDELPKQVIIKLDNKGESFFEYRITAEDGQINFRNHIKINKTVFMPEEYENLREFFNQIVNKQSEQIILKKS